MAKTEYPNNTVVKNDSVVTYSLGEIIQVCVSRDKQVYSRGIWYGENPLLNVLPVLMNQVILSVLLSQAFYYILRPFRQPKSVCNILAGIVLGPSVFGKSAAYMDLFFLPKEFIVLKTLAMLGMIFYIYVASVKMDISMITRSSRMVWAIGLSSIFFSLVVNLTLFHLLQKEMSGLVKGTIVPILVGAMSGTSFVVVAHGLTELNLLTSELGQLALSCGVVTELAWWIVQPLFIILGSKNSLLVFRYVPKLLALVLFTVLVLRPVMQWIVQITPEGRPVKQTYVLYVLLIAFTMGFLSMYSGNRFILGILLAGLAVPDGPPLGSTIVERIEHLLSEFFLPLLHVLIGYHINLPTMNLKDFSLMHFIVLISFLGKVVGVCLVSLFFHIRLRNGLLLGLVLSFKSIMEPMVFNIYREQTLISESAYGSLAVATTMVAAVATPLVEMLYNPHMRLYMPSFCGKQLRSLQSTPRNEELKILSCVHREENINSYFALFDALNPTRQNPICAYFVHLVEPIGRAAPALVPYTERRHRIIPKSSHRIMHACTNYTRSIYGSIIIQFFTLIGPYRSMHESICRIVQDKFIPLIILPFHKNQEFDDMAGFLRLFNTNIQTSASCTVGILVDRGKLWRVRRRNFSFRVCVVFLGGADDREALAFVTRLSSRVNVSITLVRIDFSEYSKDENRSDRLLDEVMLDDFKAMSDGNSSVVYREIMAVNALEVIESVRCLEDDYDLIVVGKCRGESVKFEGDMMDWVEYSELGVIGDELASSDLHGGMTPVLVMRHYCGSSTQPFISVDMKSSQANHSAVALRCN